jgi:hypothetical protein
VSAFVPSSGRLARLSLDDAERLIAQYVALYNERRLHISLGYVTPEDMIDGRQTEIHTARSQHGGAGVLGMRQQKRTRRIRFTLKSRSRLADRSLSRETEALNREFRERHLRAAPKDETLVP